MNILNPMPLLSLVVTLTIYVSGVRLVVLGKIFDESESTKREKLKRHLKFLLPADIFLTVALTLLIIFTAGPNLFEWTPFAGLFYWAVIFFIGGIIVLISHHIAIGWKTLVA